jgi:hypothetical protein
LAIASVMLSSASEIRAQVYPALQVPRECNNLPVGNKGGKVTIQAGPAAGTDLGLAADFPRKVACPSVPGVSGQCFEWEFRWIWNINPSHTFVTVPSDIALVLDTADANQPAVTPPGLQESQFKTGLNIFDVRQLRWNENAQTFRASYFTQTSGVGIGIITAGGDAGAGSAFCGIAGPTSSGASTDLFAPFVAFECKQSGDGSFAILRGQNSCIQELRAFENTTCTGTGTVVPGEALGQNILFTGPLAGNDVCPETLTVSANSPCQLYQTTSGGTVYKWCYHGGSLIGTTSCVNHSGVCATHP